MRYRLRTLLIVLALLPPLLAGGYWGGGEYVYWRERPAWGKQRADARAEVEAVMREWEALGGGFRQLGPDESARIKAMLELPAAEPNE
jgi:hypothetical protein